MTDPRPTDRPADPALDPATSPPANPIDRAAVSGSPETEATADRTPDRRAFLRQLSGDAVSTAGRLAGFTSIIRRTVVGVGASAVRGLEVAAVEVPAETQPVLPPAAPDPEPPVSEPPPDAAPAHPGLTTPAEQPPPSEPPRPSEQAPPAKHPAPSEPPVVPAAPAPPAPRDPVQALTSAHHEFLAGAAGAVMAVNDPSGPPHLTDSMVHWDGTLLRLPAQLFTARAVNVDRDPRVSLLVHGANAQSWVTITGTASLVHGEQAAIETRMILGKYVAANEVERRWAELAADGDRIVIQVRPTRFVWRLA